MLAEAVPLEAVLPGMVPAASVLLGVRFCWRVMPPCGRGRELDAESGPGARDQRLRLYRQGQWADVTRGSGWLALQTEGVTRPEALVGATEDELCGIGRTWNALERWVFTRKLVVVRELIRRYPATGRDESGGHGPAWARELHHEIAAALEISTVAAGKLVLLAWTLDNLLPGMAAALDDGRLNPGQVRMIVDETAVLEDEALFPKVERIILDGLARCKTWLALERLVQRAVIEVDPEGATRRREKAQREHARLRVWRENCGTFALQAMGLPGDAALAVDARVEGRARAYKAAGISEPMDLLRVLALCDIVNEVTIAQRVAWAQAADAEKQPPADARRVPADGDKDQDAGNSAQDDGNPNDGNPNDDGPRGGGPDGGMPDGVGPEGDASSDGPEGGDGGFGDGGDDGGDPGGGPLPEGPDGSGAQLDDDYLVCPACRGKGGGIGLPVKAGLTIPDGALEWLAEWCAGYTGRTARGPASGSGSGGGGPGRRYRGSPGPCPECGGEDSAGMPAVESLVFPLLTLLGLAGRPGEAHGLGALDPGLVRVLMAAGARHPDSQFCITVVDGNGFAVGHGCCRPMRGKKGRAIPVDPDRITISRSERKGPDGGYGSWIITLPGAALPLIVDVHPMPTYECDHRLESRGYQPSDRLRHLVQVRDGTCSFPPCSRHARESDFEHAQPYARGGRTCACNAHACSRSCHRAKQKPGWQVTKPLPGWTRWTTKAGRTYTQGPMHYPA